MSEQNPIGIQASLELVNRLHATVDDFVAREKALTRSISLSTYTFEKQRDEALESENTWLEAEDERLDGELERAKDLARAKSGKRQQWIERAWKNSKQRFLQSLAESEGQRKYNIQKTLLDSEKHRKAALSRADSDYGEFQRALDEDRRIFRSLAALALKSLRGYPAFLKALANGLKSVTNDTTHDDRSAFECRGELHEQLNLVNDNLLAFRKHFLPRFFSILPLSLLSVLIVLLHLPAIPLLGYFGLADISWPMAAGSALAFMVGAGAAHLIGGLSWRSAATTLTVNLSKARQLLDRCEQASGSSHQQRREQIARSHEDTTAKLDSEWNRVLETSAETREAKPEAVLDGKRQHAIETAKTLHQSRLQQIESRHSANVQQQKQESDARIAKATSDCDAGIRQARAKHQLQHDALTKAWRETVEPIYSVISASGNWAAENFPEWSSPRWKNWSPPESFRNFTKIGELKIDLPQLCGELPKDKALALPGPAQFSLPLMLSPPTHGSLLLETSGCGQKESVAVLNHSILGLLTGAPPGMVSFSIIDPVGLGENFSSIMHLADYENNLINDRIWTQTEQIDKRLEELNEHMEKVIQMYLRNEYETIAEYNLQAGNIAEKYHFLVIADFPTNFSDSAAKRLLSIAASGARCGVYTLIHWDTRRTIPQDFVASELRKSSVCIICGENGFALSHYCPPGASLCLDSPPTPGVATGLIQKIGAGSKDANRIEVPFSHVTPADDKLWLGDTTSELRIAIGRTGATKLQYLAIGKGTRQHTLIAGKTGSGKSTLFHVIITNLALTCSPDQVEFYLIDFKKGIEFKCYATHRLPHARVIAIESDREFGLSVLQRVDEELKRRGDLFRKLGVQDLAGYKKVGGKEVVPRSLLMIDEFQELFVEDDRISQSASMLLDRIVRQGRAFGIHVILGSQTLGGAYTLPRTTLGQMVIRIALQCNEADAYLIMDDNNPAPRLLSRPGEGIYNDSAGAVEGNSPFQTVWISDEERDAALKKVEQLAGKQAALFPEAIVFEGNAPADIRENARLKKLLGATPPHTPPLTSRTWLGAPNSIKGPTEAVFHRQSGNHLLIVGQNDEASQAIVSVSLLALAAQQAPDDSRFFLLDSSPPDSTEHKLFESLAKDLPYHILAAGGAAAVDMVAKVSQEMDRRSDDAAGGTDCGSVFLIINGLQRFKKLRFEEDFGFSTDEDASPANPGAQLDRIIQEGASLGIHLIVVCDTFNNVNRFLSRKALSEFEMRVLFQMSANDSASLIDTPKASQLGLNRALFYNEQEGHLETFRPYAPPDAEWFDQAVKQLACHQVPANP